MGVVLESIKSMRINYIDFARTLAIVLALSDHAMRHFGLMATLSGVWKYPFAVIFRSATPAFFILFGMMLELVYLKRFMRGSRMDTATRLWSRGFKCYFCFLIVLGFAAFVQLDFVGFVHSALMVSGGNSAVGVLKFYFLMLLLAPLILLLRSFLGFIGYAIFAFISWATAFALRDCVPTDKSLQYLTALIYGSPSGKSAFSLLHGAGLVCLGAWLAYPFRAGGPEKPIVEQRKLLIFTIVALGGCVFYYIVMNGLDGFVSGYKSNYFRFSHHYVYYCFSGAMALSLILFISFFEGRLGARWLSFLGRYSLASFTVGGALLVVTPGAWGGVGFVLYFPVLVCLVFVLSRVWSVVLFARSEVRLELSKSD